MEKLTHYLPPPPRFMPNGELRAIIEPPLRDLIPFPGDEMVDEWELIMDGRSDDHLTRELTTRARETALADNRVQELLSNKKHIAIGASFLHKRKDNQDASLVYVLYDYTDNFAIEVSLDKDATNIIDVAKYRYQPAPLEEEIERAIALAREDQRLKGKLTDELEGMAILVSPVDPSNPYFSHRQFDVRFGCPDERLPRYNALVDLSLELVLRVGLTCVEKGGGHE